MDEAVEGESDTSQKIGIARQVRGGSRLCRTRAMVTQTHKPSHLVSHPIVSGESNSPHSMELGFQPLLLKIITPSD